VILASSVVEIVKSFTSRRPGSACRNAKMSARSFALIAVSA